MVQENRFVNPQLRKPCDLRIIQTGQKNEMEAEHAQMGKHPGSGGEQDASSSDL